jgi:UDP:flavonoid glycosyltransferase YjiC (YdhE family)
VVVSPPTVERVSHAVAPLWAEWGLEPDPTAGLFRDVYVDICPPTLQKPEIEEVPCRRLRLRPEGYDGWSGSAKPIEPTDRPTIYITLGTVGRLNRTETFQLILDALAGLDARLVVTIGKPNDPAALGPLRRECRSFATSPSR